MYTISSDYFYGNKVSDYGLERGYVDYRTLAKAFDSVLNNEIIKNTYDIGYWNMESGFIDNSDEIDELQDKIDELQDKIDELQDADEIDELKHKISLLEDKIDELTEAQENTPDIFQYFIVSDGGAEILQEAGEIVFYNDTLDMYVWGVTHWGTSWDYVLTDIKIVKE